MDRWWYAAPLIVALLGCTKPNPQPPEPPEPPHDPLCQGTVVCDCWHRPPGADWIFEKCPTPPPTPPPTPTKCTVSLEGQPWMKAYLLYPRVVDSTPLIFNAERCRAIGFGERMSCPVTLDEDPQRYPCEIALMGGPPAYTLAVDEGGLRVVDEDGWKARIIGVGKGRVRSCYPNGKACSDWIELAYTE